MADPALVAPGTLLLSDILRSFTWDSAGRPVTIAYEGGTAVPVTYDALGRAVTASGGLGSGACTYDGNGLRVKKVAGSTTTVYLFSGSKVIAEYQNGAAPSAPTTEYVYAGGALVAKVNSSGELPVIPCLRFS